MTTIKVKAHKNNKWAWPIEVKNKTVKTLSNGVVIPTWSAMLRQAAKV